MPRRSNCCVPLCFNNFRNHPELQYYRLPKDKEIRKQYIVLMRNSSLKEDKDNTRICSAHFEGGRKLSRCHLPSIFPWTKEKNPRRKLKRLSSEELKSLPKKRRKLSMKTKKEKESLNPSASASDQSGELAPPVSVFAGQVEKIEANTQTEYIDELQNNQRIDASTQTEEIRETHLTREIAKLEKENKSLKQSLQKNNCFDIDRFKEKDENICFYTGFPNYDTLMLCYNLIKDHAENISYGGYDRKTFDTPKFSKPGRPRALSKFQEFVLVMMRLRLGLFERDLAHRFNISETTVSVIIRTWLRFLRMELQDLILIPPRDVLKAFMPALFKEFYPNTVLIIDCTEVQMESPSALDKQSMCYSSYKSRPTMKCLVGITPSGVIGFVSQLYPGSTTDKEITVKSGLLDKLERGDEVMADKGFLIQDELANIGVTLTMPVFLKGKKQFLVEETEKNKKVASLRVHVERCMERIKNWHILDRPLPISLSPVAEDMFITIAALTNFHPPLIS